MTTPAPVEPTITQEVTVPALRDQLVRRRQGLGISQAELAARLGVTQTAVSYWETGQRQPGLDDVERWAAALGAAPTLLQGSPAAGSRALRDQLAEAMEAARLTGHDGWERLTDAVLPAIQAALAEERRKTITALADGIEQAIASTDLPDRDRAALREIAACVRAALDRPMEPSP